VEDSAAPQPNAQPDAKMAEHSSFHAFLLGLRIEPATMQQLFADEYAEWLAMHSQMHEESMRNQIRFQVNKIRRAVQAAVAQEGA
jgi:hypothetical protein